MSEPTSSTSSATPIKMRVRETIVLRVIGKALVPFILLFALYVQFHGDYGPGGGFQAGVIFAAGLILHALIYGLDSLREKVLWLMKTRFSTKAALMVSEYSPPPCCPAVL